ncbi:hypothetical protein M426DRAFT_11717 [Hypoxylon sp. CI-4A]|nr:hypothetical protein M426DRAFT_11717 [Hypoxylon sp. CI-4A]
MASYLDQKQVTARVVTIGGAVNTVYLRSRPSTHDVDFFLGNATSPQHNVIHEAARYANKQTRGALGAEWFNNSTQLFMPPHVQQDLANAAFQQNVVIYNKVGRGGGLVVYGAPWSYALCGKFNRLCESSPRPYDLADAVVYLHEHLRRAGQQTVSVHLICRWCQQYHKQVTNEVIQQVDEAYYRAYGHRPIDWRSQT